MKRASRIIALILVLVTVFSLLTIVASASCYYGTNARYTVKTGSRPWYSILPATIVVENDGNSTMSVYIQNSQGQLVSILTSLKSGKSHTFSLKPNQTYTVYWVGNTLSGGSYKASGYISSGRYISSIKAR